MQGETQSMQAQQLEQQQQQQKQEAVQQQQVQHEQEHNGRNHGSSRKASAGKIEQDVHGDAFSTNGSQDDGEHVEETKSDRASTAPAETATTAASDTDRLAASPVTSGAARRVKLEPIASADPKQTLLAKPRIFVCFWFHRAAAWWWRCGQSGQIFLGCIETCF